MIKNNPAERVIHAVVNVVTSLPVAHGLSNDPGDGGCCRGHQKTPRLRQHLNFLRKQSFYLCVNLSCKLAEGFHVLVVSRREPAPYVEYLDGVPA